MKQGWGSWNNQVISNDIQDPEFHPRHGRRAGSCEGVLNLRGLASVKAVPILEVASVVLVELGQVSSSIERKIGDGINGGCEAPGAKLIVSEKIFRVDCSGRRGGAITQAIKHRSQAQHFVYLMAGRRKKGVLHRIHRACRE